MQKEEKNLGQSVQSKKCANLHNLKEKDRELLRNLYQNREGLRVRTLTKLTNLKTRNLYRRLNFLRNLDLVENIYPIWKIIQGRVEKCSLLLKESKIFELHNLAYIITLIKTPDWWNKRSRKLMKLKGFLFKKVQWGNNPYQQLINENYVIQTYPESVIIICRKRYYSDNPYEVIINAMNEFLDLWAWFEERLRFKFFLNGIPQVKLRSNDFNRLKDILSEHCKKRGRGFEIEIPDKGKVWVDFSEPFGKEANYPAAQEKLELVTKDLLLKESFLPSEMKGYLEQTAIQINEVSENQLMFAKNIDKHMGILQEIGKAIKELRQTIKQRQSKLGEFI